MKHQRLCEEVERVVGHTVRTAAEFEELSEQLFRQMHYQLSSTTLKRLWGYLDECVETRRATLDVLARFVGCRDYDAFLQTAGGVQSNLVLAERVAADGLPVGQRVCLTWRPDRRVVVEHLGEGRFCVVESLNSKLVAGDTFRCHLMIAHEPLFLDDVVHDGCLPTAYVAGKQDGVLFELLA